MENEIKVPSKCNWKEIVNRVGTAFALFAVIIAVIFVFLTGFDINNLAASEIANSIPNFEFNSRVSIYDYFYKNYAQIKEVCDNISGALFVDTYTLIEPSMYIPAVICTITALGMLASVIALGVMSIIKLARKLMGQEVCDAEKYALGTVMAYVLGSAVLKVFNHVSVDAYYITYSSSTGGVQYASLSMAYTYNTATLTGIVLCAISLGVCIACRIAAKGAELKQCNTVTRGIFTVVSIALAGVVAHYATCALYSMSGQYNGLQLSFAMSTSTLAQAYARALGMTDDPFNIVYFMFTLLTFLQLGVLAVAFATLITQIKHIFENKKDNCFVLSIVLAAICFEYLMAAILTDSELIQGENNGMDAKFAPAIVALVIALFNLCTAVARKLIKPVTVAASTTAEIKADEANA